MRQKTRTLIEQPEGEGTYIIMARSSTSEGQVVYHCAMAFAKSRGGSGRRSELGIQ